MADDTLEPLIMASSTIRPTLVKAPSSAARTTGLTPGVSTADDVQAVVLGMKAKEATRLLEPLGYVVDLTPASDGSGPDARGANAERVILAIADGRVTGVAFG